MKKRSGRVIPRWFPAGCRASGVLLHVASLPSPYGIGDVGPAASAWVDRLHEAEQTWWQAWRTRSTRCGSHNFCCSDKARLQEYARAKGVRLIGELPFFVSPDSSDVWANPELFLLDDQHRLRFVAGVPPGYFSVEGQLWGNPVYDWEAVRRAGCRWCLDRIRALLGHVDMIRLDHFRAFAAAWHVPIGAATARTGQWVPGPGADFFWAAEKDLSALPFIAEDLGLITPDVSALRDQFQLPGCGCCNSRSTANRTTLTRRTTIRPTLSSTPAPATIPRRAAGSKSCRISNDNVCGIT